MAVENRKSTIVANKDLSPAKANDNVLDGGRLKAFHATVEVAAADDDGSTYRLFRVHSSWLVSRIDIFNDAITGGVSYDVGLYQTQENGGAVKNATAYASAVDMSAARVAPLDVTFEARNIDQMERKVWQDAGDLADPNRFYDVVLRANTVGTAAGTISARLQAMMGD
jgi:hypothetical protein